MNRNGELTIREGKPEREYLSLLLHSLAKDCRKSSTPSASTENPRNDVSDKALAEQIDKQLPSASPEDRAIIYRAITLKDQQKTSWKAFITGSFWPSDRKDQIKTMCDFLNPVTKFRHRKSAPEVKSQGQKLSPEARQVMKEVKDGNLKQGEAKFFKLSNAEMQKMLDKLKDKLDLCKFDKSEQCYNDVKKGLSGLLTGESREKRILDEAKEFKKNTGIRSPVHVPKKAVELVHAIKEDQLKQQAWELLVYLYDIKIAVKPALEGVRRLQQRIIHEKLADTLGEATVLSQLISEMLGPRKDAGF